MGRIIITYNDVYEVNQLLESRGLSFKIHLHDMCGSQSYNVEPLSSCSCEGRYDEMKTTVIEYFEKKGIQADFPDNDQEFTLS